MHSSWGNIIIPDISSKDSLSVTHASYHSFNERIASITPFSGMWSSISPLIEKGLSHDDEGRVMKPRVGGFAKMLVRGGKLPKIIRIEAWGSVVRILLVRVSVTNGVVVMGFRDPAT